MKITVKKYRPGTPDTDIYPLDVPALPNIGDYLASDKQNFSGIVAETLFFEDDKGVLHIEVKIK